MPSIWSVSDGFRNVLRHTCLSMRVLLAGRHEMVRPGHAFSNSNSDGLVIPGRESLEAAHVGGRPRLPEKDRRSRGTPLAQHAEELRVCPDALCRLRAALFAAELRGPCRARAGSAGRRAAVSPKRRGRVGSSEEGVASQRCVPGDCRRHPAAVRRGVRGGGVLQQRPSDRVGGHAALDTL
eukprot:1811981-Rhodomonas_salina.1